VVILILAESSFVVTKENEYTLVKQFGKIDHVVTDAGLSFKLPFIQTTDTLPKATLLYDLDPSDVITMDKKTMVANSYVLWRITDPIRFAQTLNSSVSNAESRINTIVYNSMKNVISSMTQEEVISGRAGVLSQQMMEGIGNSIEQYGMELLSIEMKHLDLPGENKTAVYERMISERDKIAATYTAEGESEAQIIRNTTDKEIAISLSEAQAQAEKIEAEGEAEYMRVLSEAYADKSRSEFYSFVRALDAAKAALKGGNKTLVLDKDSPLAQIFYTE
jgi:membrane protease subunit HflC